MALAGDAGWSGSSRPLSLFDIGASAGLNLVAEAVEVRWRRSTGASLSVARDLDIRRRTGFDPRPLDVTRAEDRDWLKACVWPEQRARLERLDAAIAAFPKASPRPELLLLRGSSAPAKLEAATEGHPGRARDRVPDARQRLHALRRARRVRGGHARVARARPARATRLVHPRARGHPRARPVVRERRSRGDGRSGREGQARANELPPGDDRRRRRSRSPTRRAAPRELTPADGSACA
ncbi:MAG: DUF2332 family protein [Polyangiaceae bacterium]|nr:DUF2332 family protein [Polyangiaceae bacterium]